MKYAILLAAGAVLALGACRESGEPAPDATPAAEAAEPAEPAAAAPAGAAAFTAGQPPSPEFMVGTWGEGEQCSDPINFAAGGTIVDGPMDTWKIEGGQLVMDDLIEIGVVVVDAETMTATLEGDAKTLKRCD